MLRLRIERAEQVLELAAKHVYAQRELVERLRDGNSDLRELAISLLTIFEASYSLHAAHLARLRKELLQLVLLPDL